MTKPRVREAAEQAKGVVRNVRQGTVAVPRAKKAAVAGPAMDVSLSDVKPAALSSRPEDAGHTLALAIFGIRRSPSAQQMAMHEMVTGGISTAKVAALKKTFHVIGDELFFKTLGINARTFDRRHKSKTKVLDVNASDRALRLATVMDLATHTLGSHDEAERWLSSPAIGLDGNKPIDLLQSSDGTDLVKTLLTRMDYGVYA